MAGLREGESNIEAVKLTPTCGCCEEAHFTCGVPEEVITRPLEVFQREHGDVEGLPPLISVFEPRGEDESEGDPRLMLLSAAQQMVLQVAVTARRLRPCVFGSMLESGGEFPPHTEAIIHDMLKGVLDGRLASWSFGVTGVGKSRRTPPAALLETAGEEAKGMLHVLPPAFTLASYSRLQFYPESEIVVLTSGKGKDSWTLKADIVFDCSESIILDSGALHHKCSLNEVSNLQREGRVGRMDFSLVHHLADAQ